MKIIIERVENDGESHGISKKKKNCFIRLFPVKLCFSRNDDSYHLAKFLSIHLRILLLQAANDSSNFSSPLIILYVYCYLFYNNLYLACITKFVFAT